MFVSSFQYEKPVTWEARGQESVFDYALVNKIIFEKYRKMKIFVEREVFVLLLYEIFKTSKFLF